MFFTVRGIEGFVINIEDFENDPILWNQIYVELKPNYKLAFTSRKLIDYNKFQVDQQDVFYPQSSIESSMYQNVIRRAIQKMGTKPSSTIFICRHATILRYAHELSLCANNE